MIGAIIGDIVGSRFEFDNHRSKEFELFHPDCQLTDDSIMTFAVAKSIMQAAGDQPISALSEDVGFFDRVSDLTVINMREFGRAYPGRGYGGMFARWLASDSVESYNSFGNGAAMRVSPAGFAATSTYQAAALAETVTEVTHSHPEGIKGAQATAVAIALARGGATKRDIRREIERDYYPLDFQIDDIRDSYQFNETCQETVPQAIECFLESTSFEDAIRTAISLGGDSDTIAAITGAIAQAYYGVPADLRERALTYLDTELRAIYGAWERFAPEDNEAHRVLTKYIGLLESAESLGEWVVDTTGDGTPENPIQFPWTSIGSELSELMSELYEFLDRHTEFIPGEYRDVLSKAGIGGEGGLRADQVDPSEHNAAVMLALLMWTSRADRFCEGALLVTARDGHLVAWLKRLKDLDWSPLNRRVESVAFETGGFFGGHVTNTFTIKGDQVLVCEMCDRSTAGATSTPAPHSMSPTEFQEQFAALHVEYWAPRYTDNMICDGDLWSLKVRYTDGYYREYHGGNAYPANWVEALELLGDSPQD